MSDQQSKADFQGPLTASMDSRYQGVVNPAPLDEQAEACAEGPAAEQGEYKRSRVTMFRFDPRTGGFSEATEEDVADHFGGGGSEFFQPEPGLPEPPVPGEPTRETLIQMINGLTARLMEAHNRQDQMARRHAIEERMAVAERLIGVAIGGCACERCVALREVLTTQNHVIAPLLAMIESAESRIVALEAQRVRDGVDAPGDYWN